MRVRSNTGKRSKPREERKQKSRKFIIKKERK
jgi:hypothetical protein